MYWLTCTAKQIGEGGCEVNQRWKGNNAHVKYIKHIRYIDGGSINLAYIEHFDWGQVPKTSRILIVITQNVVVAAIVVVAERLARWAWTVIDAGCETLTSKDYIKGPHED